MDLNLLLLSFDLVLLAKKKKKKETVLYGMMFSKGQEPFLGKCIEGKEGGLRGALSIFDTHHT